MITYQANCIDPTEKQKQQVENVIPLEMGNNSNTYMIVLQYPSFNQPQLPKWKWALVFTSMTEVNKFIQELEQSEEKQSRICIEEYSVFGNVMFVFLKKQVKLNIWCSHVKDLIKHLPLGVFIFNERFKHLVELVEQGSSLYYQIDWNCQLNLKTQRNFDEGNSISPFRNESPQFVKKVINNSQQPISLLPSQMPQYPLKRKRGRPSKSDQIMRQKILEEKGQFPELIQDKKMILPSQQTAQQKQRDVYLDMLDNLNYKYKRRYRRARISNEEIAIKFDDFGECLLSLMDDQNYFLRGFYECISQLKI